MKNLSREIFRRLRILGGGRLGALFAAVVVSAAGAASPPPNFIVILTDDQGWGTTSVQIDPKVPESKSDFFQTPNLERLAAAGMRFTQAYAAHPNCSPSRAALLTGRSPAALHLTDIVERNDGPNYVGQPLIPPRHVSALSTADATIPELLKAFDPAYRTAHLGKWHLGGSGPAAHGFDVSDGPTGNGDGQSRDPENPKKIFGLTRRAIAFIDAQVKSGHPFYLQISHYGTHEPSQSRPATLAKFQQAKKGARHTNAKYGAMLFDLDEGVGELLDAVKAAGIADRTYIIFTSDNGSTPTRDPGNINGPVRGSKATAWEGGVRVPFFVVGPGVRPGTISRTPIVGYDLLPTICELAGVPDWPKTVEGGSFKSTILGDGTAPVRRPNDFLVFHWPHYQLEKKSVPDTTLLADGWKLHFWWEKRNVQLFHLDRDLGETRDLASGEPKLAAAMKGKLENYLAKIDAQLPVENPDFDPARQPSSKKKRATADQPD